MYECTLMVFNRQYMLANCLFAGRTVVLLMIYQVFRQGHERLLESWPEGHREETIAPGELSDLIQRETQLHLVNVGATKDFLRVPPPDALPLALRVHLQCVEHHNQACRPTIRRLILRGKLFC
jgi:hypothetical protein